MGILARTINIGVAEYDIVQTVKLLVHIKIMLYSVFAGTVWANGINGMSFIAW
jgi:hypothetical protein